MNDQRTNWFTAFIPDSTPVILKLRLREYSIGHEILLHRFHSPFVPSVPSVPSIDDLVLATLICSQDFDGALKTLRSPGLGLFLKLWRLRLRRSLITGSLITGISQFIAYRAAGLWAPEVNPPAAGGRALNAPHLFRLLAWLMKEMNMAARDALNYPIARAHILWAAQGDHEGTLDLFGPADQALLDKAAEIAAEEKAKC